MKLSQFKTMLRELIREEVQLAVRKELKTITEQKVVAKQKPASRPSYTPPTRTTPLVTLDAPLGMSADSPLGSILQETANNMAGFGDESYEEANPDFPMGSSGTDMFIKDYSEVLKKSQAIR